MTENTETPQVLIAPKEQSPPRPSSPGDLSPDQQREFYYFLQLNRQLETRLERLFRQGKIVGGLYSSLGQEAISVGSAAALEQHDWLAPMIRNIGALLVKGVPPRDIFTQHMARATSPTHGKDGTNHFADLKNRHIASPSSMLGDLIPVMTGVAMAGRYLGQKIVALTFIGEGGTSTGTFHEGMNLAAAQRAPLVVILENNQWAYSTPASRQAPLRDFADRAKAYGIRSSIIDGNDVLAVYRAAREAVAECRAGRGPWLIEAKTMRMKGHAQHDAADYVPKEMFDYWKARDPLDRFAKYLGERSLMTREQRAEIDARVENELNIEQSIAEEAPFPAPQTAAEGVYCEGCHTIEAEWKRPLEEVMPPATSTDAVWKITNFGALGGVPQNVNTAQAPQQPHAPQQKQQLQQHRQKNRKHRHGEAPDQTRRQNQPRAHQERPPHQRPSQQGPAQHRPPQQRKTPNLPQPDVGTEEDNFVPPPAVGPEDTAPRVPFGRGPKDRAFAEQQPQRPPQQFRRHGPSNRQANGPKDRQSSRPPRHGHPSGHPKNNGKGKR
jgi:TPP-dependent pyruvate/acetoin dehydrogenase alpha subunit